MKEYSGIISLLCWEDNNSCFITIKIIFKHKDEIDSFLGPQKCKSLPQIPSIRGIPMSILWEKKNYSRRNRWDVRNNKEKMKQ